jgi:hypothetical protein
MSMSTAPTDAILTILLDDLALLLPEVFPLGALVLLDAVVVAGALLCGALVELGDAEERELGAAEEGEGALVEEAVESILVVAGAEVGA